MENNLKQSMLAYSTLCKMLDEKNLKYKKNEEELSILCPIQGDDLPMNIVIQIDPKRLLISLLAPIGFDVPEDHRAEISIATNAVNLAIVDGSFDYNFLNGSLGFRLTSSFLESIISKELFEYMLLCACNTIDEYNDKFLVVSKSKMNASEIIHFMQN